MVDVNADARAIALESRARFVRGWASERFPSGSYRCRARREARRETEHLGSSLASDQNVAHLVRGVSCSAEAATK